MLEHVAAAVDTRPLAVPHGEYAVVARTGKQISLLAAPYRRGPELLVDPRLEVNGVLLQKLSSLPQALVQPAQGRTTVAGDEAGGIQSGGCIALLLQHGQTRQRLGAGEVQMARRETVFVVQTDFGQRHKTALLLFL
ncbi:hypothetical protein SRABI70_03400 [Pseudomonas sp. Bi70]|nr:hypothetical protein SRABI70_03400 [Pseudomonas sp. Bi70]